MREMMNFQRRLLMCRSCSAPLEVEAGGGVATCGQCGQAGEVGPRPERRIEPSATGEPERLRRLRRQNSRPMVVPRKLRSLIVGNSIPAWKTAEALSAWRATQQAATAADPAACETLLFLTLALGHTFLMQQDHRARRALLETALESFPLPRHRQMILGLLAGDSVVAGDLESAEQWLACCDPRSDDIETDSAFRIASAILLTARQDWAGVHRVLGADRSEVPINDADDARAALVRANAWERRGDPARAAGLLMEYMKAGGAPGRKVLGAIVRVYPGLDLCPQSLPEAEGRYARQAGKLAASLASGGLGMPVTILGVVLTSVILCISPPWEDPPGWQFGLLDLVPGLLCLAIGLAGIRSARRAKLLRQQGIPARAAVVNVAPTGSSINDIPRYRVTLNILREGHDPYQATTKILFPPHVAAHLVPGVEVPVRVSPRDPRQVLLETA